MFFDLVSFSGSPLYLHNVALNTAEHICNFFRILTGSTLGQRTSSTSFQTCCCCCFKLLLLNFAVFSLMRRKSELPVCHDRKVFHALGRKEILAVFQQHGWLNKGTHIPKGKVDSPLLYTSISSFARVFSRKEGWIWSNMSYLHA